MKLLCLTVFVAVIANAQVQKEQVRKVRSQAAIIWSGNQIYDLCQLYRGNMRGKMRGQTERTPILFAQFGSSQTQNFPTDLQGWKIFRK
jgi:hypothetical protein